MAKVASKSAAVVGGKKKTGASRRQTQKRVGKPLPLAAADTTTPEKAESWLYAAGRTQLASGRTLRTSAEADTRAYPDIESACRAHAAALKERGVAPALVAGAGRICKRLEAVQRSGRTSEPASLAVQRTAAWVATLRESLNRLLHGSRNAAARKSFGLSAPLHPIYPSNVLQACQGIIDGEPKARATEAAGLITAADIRELRAQMKVIRAEQEAAVKGRKVEASQTAERDILTAALELFYDKYAAAIGLVLAGEPVARLEALGVVPRREERRGKGEESGVGAGSGA